MVVRAEIMRLSHQRHIQLGLTVAVLSGLATGLCVLWAGAGGPTSNPEVLARFMAPAEIPWEAAVASGCSLSMAMILATIATSVVTGLTTLYSTSLDMRGLLIISLWLVPNRHRPMLARTTAQTLAAVAIALTVRLR